MSAVGEAVRSGSSRGRRLSRREKVALAGEIVATYVRIRYTLVRQPDLPRVLEVIRRPRPEPRRHPGRSPLEVGARLGNGVARTLALLPADSRCLMRSLVLVSLLSRRGVASNLVIGVCANDGRFDAHAWVEYEGRALLPPGEGYARLTQL